MTTPASAAWVCKSRYWVCELTTPVSHTSEATMAAPTTATTVLIRWTGRLLKGRAPGAAGAASSYREMAAADDTEGTLAMDIAARSVMTSTLVNPDVQHLLAFRVSSLVR